jgi:hypothetical protein
MLKFSSRATLIQTQMDSLLSIRNKFVGDVDLPESLSTIYALRWYHINLSLFSGEEPLLKESRRRFVLFPIQYHEVRVVSYALSLSLLLTIMYTDLADVQEGRSLFLDRGRDGPVQRHPRLE